MLATEDLFGFLVPDVIEGSDLVPPTKNQRHSMSPGLLNVIAAHTLSLTMAEAA